MHVDWTALGQFISTVGIPAALLFLFFGPVVYALYRVISKWGPQIADSHVRFLDAVTTSSNRNSETLERLEKSISQKHADHSKTHEALTHAAEAGIHLIDGRTEEARRKFTSISEILKD